MRTLSLHSHTIYSERDAIIDPEKAAAKIAANGGTHYAVSDHGTATGWIALRDACKKHKLTPVYGVELYINDFWPLLQIVRAAREQASPKERTNATLGAIKQFAGQFMSGLQLTYFFSGLEEVAGKPAEIAKKLLNRLAFGYQHLVCTAMTKEGRDALIRLHNKGWAEGYYFKPQVTTDDCIRADIESGGGLLWTSACMGGPISYAMKADPSGALAKTYLSRWEFAKDRWHLEVQPLDLLDQRIYNEHLIRLSQETGFPLCLSQDNHHLNENEWISHRLLMLGQNNEPVNKIEDIYQWQGQSLAFSDLKKRLGKQTTWETQQIIKEENIPVIVKAGHHYGDVLLHWRTNEAVAHQCETTNPELLPYLEECFARNDRFCDMIQDIPWSHDFRIPKYADSRERVINLCITKMRELGINNNTAYVDWLKREDRVISACGFYDYLWTLYLVCAEAQKRGIPIGYARGSGGGCLIMYLLGVIRVDPVKYGLFFDRFLNPARLGLNPITLEKEKDMASCPDVDLDFSSIHRKEVIQLTRDLFGADRVIPVGTINLSKLKSAFADLCRVCGIKQADYIPVSKELPEDPAQKMSFEEALLIPAFKKFVDQHTVIKNFLNPLVGVAKARGQHAGGVCISDVAIADHIPVVRAGSKDDGGVVTGFGESGAVRALESCGYIKFDFLATDTVDHVSMCARLLHEDHIAKGGDPWGDNILYPEQVPSFTLDDPEVMKAIFHTGNTDGIFQMEETIGKDLCTLVKPDSVGELADISTMIRPGCLQAPAVYTMPDHQGKFVRSEGVGLHFEYASRKFHAAYNPPPDLPDEILKEIQPTHYCCIYQEQMMGLIVVLSGAKLSLGEGDIYRRNIEQMGKGKADAAEEVAKIEAQIKEAGAYPAHIIDQVTTIIKGGASYAFNKSHSLSYSLFSYAQAWFKHYYPHIFLAAHVTLLANKNKLAKAHKITNNLKQRGLTVSSPSLVHSSDRATWSPDERTVFLPFQVMKGFRAETSRELQAIATQCQTVPDFLKQAIPCSEIKKNHAISLAKIGGLDLLSGNDLTRQQTIAMVAYVWNLCTSKTKPETVDKHVADFLSLCTPLVAIPKQRLMDWELEVFGGFINECPLTDSMIERFDRMGFTALSQIEPEPDQEFNVYFMITSITRKVHKPGSKYAGKEWYKLTCWDGTGVGDLSIWAKDLIGDDERGILGYKDKIFVNKCYTARISCDGQRPTTLVYRGHGSGETLYIQEEV